MAGLDLFVVALFAVGIYSSDFFFMNYETLYELACGRISDLVDQMLIHQEKGDEVMVLVVNAEVQDLIAVLDSDNAADEVFYARDFRTLY